MTDTHASTTPSGIAVLAEDEPTWEDGPFTVRGVALPEDIAPNSANTESLESDERVQTYWPPDVVEAAAAQFDGVKITDGSEHDPESVRANPQPSPETIVGEITQATYRPGTGVLYEGEVDDPELAKRIQRGRVDVSPTIFRDLGDETEDGLHPVSEVQGVRDLSIVAEGAADGNSIEPAQTATAAMSSMAAEVLAATFEDGGVETLKTVAGVSFDGTAGGSLDESAIPSDDFASHYLFDGDTKSDSSYPVVDADGNLRRGNVESAFQLGARGGVSEADLHSKLRSLNDEFDDRPIDPEKLSSETMGAESPADPAGDTGDDGQDDGTGQSTVGPADTEHMTEDELTDAQRELLAAAENVENSDAVEVLRAAADCEEPAVHDDAEYEVHEEGTVESLEADLETMKRPFAEALEAQGSPLDAETLAEKLDVDELTEPFTDDEGDIDAETLAQVPESGTPAEEGDLDPEAETLVEQYGSGDREDAVETLKTRYERFDGMGWDDHAEDAKAQLEQLGVEV